jgi:glycosyltransferase involved in cell wall biosynthesis
MLLHKEVDFDARVRREARALADAGHRVTVLDLPRDPAAGERVLPGGVVARSVTPPRWGRRKLPGQLHRGIFLASFVRAAVRLRPDVIHAHDAAMLAPGLIAARLARARLVYDSHELATGVQWRTRFWARIVFALERVAAPRADAVITVSDGIARTLQARYGLARAPVVVRNVPDVDGAAEATGDVRGEIGVGDAPLILHHGSAARGRGCDALVGALARLPGPHLLFLGPESRADVERLEAAARAAGVADRVHVTARVPVGDVLGAAAQADVGVSLLEDTCENHRLALPNKVFDYLAAGLPVVVSDLPELGGLVRARGVGAVARPGDEADIARALAEVIGEANRDGLRERVAAASAELRWSRERERLQGLYARLEAL